MITRKIKAHAASMDYPFYLSVSCGYLHFLPEEDRSIDYYIHQTDDIMYQTKAYMHASDPELKAFVARCKSSRVP